MKLLVALPVLLGSCLAAGPHQDADDKTRERVFALIDRFDTLDSSKLPFVRVTYTSGFGDPVERLGFILHEGKGLVTIRYVDLGQGTVTPTMKGDRAVSIERIDIAHAARDLAKSLDTDRRYYLNPDAPVARSGQLLLLARACARRGMREETIALWHAAGPIDRALDDLASGLENHLSMSFTDPAVTRVQLEARHRLWLEAFPDSREKEFVAGRAERLRKILDEPAFSKEEKATPVSLVRALRDEFHPVREWGADGWFVSSPAEKRKDRPSERLLGLGVEAVPALIEAIRDETPTRCVWYSSRYGGSFRILPVGTFAEELLQVISGLQIYGSTQEREAAWRDWWKRVGIRGEDAVLAELVEKGDHTSVGAAKTLLARHPKELQSVMRGAREADNTWVREELVKLVAKSRDESATAFLLEELKTGPQMATRVVVSQALLERGRREGLDVFVQAWSSDRSRKSPEIEEVDRAIADQGAWDSVAKFLLLSGDVTAVRTVTQDLPSRSSAVRRGVLRALRGEDLPKILESASSADRPVIERDIESLIVGLLEDGDRHTGSYGFPYRGGFISLLDPRTCDLAACLLSDFWPRRYEYDPTRPSRVRDREILKLRNVWLGAKSMPRLKLPDSPDVRSRDPEARAALDRLLASRDVEARKREVVRLERFGLGALPWVQEELRKLASDHQARSELGALAGRLRNTVGEATLYGADWEGSEPLSKAVQSLQGKSLEATAVIGLVREAYRALQGENGIIDLVVDRDVDGTGVTLSLRVERTGGRGGVSSERKMSAMAAGKDIGLSSGSGTRSCLEDEGGLRIEERTVGAALQAPHDASFEIRIGIRLD